MKSTATEMERRLVEVKLCGTYMVTNLTANELAKLDMLQRFCPLIDVQLIPHGDGYLILGYKGDASDDEPLIRVENESLPQAERVFMATYNKLMAAGWLSAGVRRAIA